MSDIDKEKNITDYNYKNLNTKSLCFEKEMSFPGNASFELNQGTYSDETEIISPYIESLFTGINSTLSGFNSLIQSANNYLKDNEEIENMSLPDLQEINFSIEMLPNNGSKNKTAIVDTDRTILRVRSGPGNENNIKYEIPSGTTVNVLKSEGDWTKISYENKNGQTDEGYVLNSFLKYNNGE